MRSRRNITTRARKTPRVRIEDAPGCTISALDITRDNRPFVTLAIYPREVNSQGLSTANASSNSYEEESTQIEKELNLISTSVLPPRYKELVLTSIYLAPLHFSRECEMLPSKETF